jgi:hypothetical protein
VKELAVSTFKEVNFVGRKLNGKASSINVVIITTIIVIKINLFMIIL